MASTVILKKPIRRADGKTFGVGTPYKTTLSHAAALVGQKHAEWPPPKTKAAPLEGLAAAMGDEPADPMPEPAPEPKKSKKDKKKKKKHG